MRHSTWIYKLGLISILSTNAIPPWQSHKTKSRLDREAHHCLTVALLLALLTPTIPTLRIQKATKTLSLQRLLSFQQNPNIKNPFLSQSKTSRTLSKSSHLPSFASSSISNLSKIPQKSAIKAFKKWIQHHLLIGQTPTLKQNQPLVCQESHTLSNQKQSLHSCL